MIKMAQGSNKCEEVRIKSSEDFFPTEFQKLSSIYDIYIVALGDSRPKRT